MIDIDDIRAQIKKKTGIDAAALNGETAEELISQTKAVLASEQDRYSRDTRKQFAEWAENLASASN